MLIWTAYFYSMPHDEKINWDFLLAYSRCFLRRLAAYVSTLPSTSNPPTNRTRMRSLPTTVTCSMTRRIKSS